MRQILCITASLDKIITGVPDITQEDVKNPSKNHTRSMTKVLGQIGLIL